MEVIVFTLISPVSVSISVLLAETEATVISFLAFILIVSVAVAIKSLVKEPIEPFTAVRVNFLPVIFVEASRLESRASKIELSAVKVTSPLVELIVFTLISPVTASISVLFFEVEVTVPATLILALISPSTEFIFKSPLAVVFVIMLPPPAVKVELMLARISASISPFVAVITTFPVADISLFTAFEAVKVISAPVKLLLPELLSVIEPASAINSMFPSVDSIVSRLIAPVVSVILILLLAEALK